MFTFLMILTMIVFGILSLTYWLYSFIHYLFTRQKTKKYTLIVQGDYHNEFKRLLKK